MDLKKNFEFLSSTNRIRDDIKTVDDLLARDDVNQILSDTVEAKKDIKHLIVAWENEEGVLDWRVTNMKMSKMIGLLEMVKMYAVMDNEYNECSDD